MGALVRTEICPSITSPRTFWHSVLQIPRCSADIKFAGAYTVFNVFKTAQSADATDVGILYLMMFFLVSLLHNIHEQH